MWRALFFLAAALATTVVAQQAAVDPYVDGRQAYVTRCLPCHERKKIDYDPAAYSQRGLWEMVNRMAPMARLDYYQQNDVVSYLEAGRKGALTVPRIASASTNKPAAATTASPKTGMALAQELYVTNCASCHAHKVEPINPKKYTEAKLNEWTQRMGPIAKLTPEQTNWVWHYLDDVRTGKSTLPGALAAKQK